MSNKESERNHVKSQQQGSKEVGGSAPLANQEALNPAASDITYSNSALEALRDPNQLDVLIQITNPHSWLALITLCGILLTVLIWSIWGIIPQRVNGNGILVAAGSSIYNAVAPEPTAQIRQILVKEGDYVTKGQDLMRLDCFTLQEQWQAALNYLQNLQHERSDLAMAAEHEVGDYHRRIIEQNKRLERVASTTAATLKSSNDLTASLQWAYKQGYETKQHWVAAARDSQESKTQLEQAKVQLSQNAINERGFMDQWQERLRNLDLRIIEQQKQTDELKAQWQLAQNVTSPISGQVIALLHNVGDSVSKGLPLLSIAPVSNTLDALVFIPAAEGKKVRPGMLAMLLPSTVRKNEFGNIKGNVIEVARYPSSPESIMALLQNQSLAKIFSANEPPVITRIRLQVDKNTYSGYKWTSALGPKQRISAGTLIESKITVEKSHPISLIIPALKSWLGA